MIRRWKKLDDLPCVKIHGIKHKIAHFIGTHSVFFCIGASIDDGLRKGITEKEDE